MEKKGIHKYLLLIVLLLSAYFILRFKLNNDKILHAGFPKLNNIELYVESDLDYIYAFIDNFNLNNNEAYSHLDNSRNLLIQNSLKKTSISKLNIYKDIFFKPTLNDLLLSMSNLTSDINQNENNLLQLLDEITTLISRYLYKDNINTSIGIDILESIVLESRIDLKSRGLYKIDIIINEKFLNISDFKNEYLKVFKYINNVKSDDFKINNVKFYNSYAYELFANYKDNNSVEINSEYHDFVLCYIDKAQLYNSIFPEEYYDYDKIKINSIIDYLTDESLVGDKYKDIKKIHYNVSKYNNEDNFWLPYQRLNNISRSISQIELNVHKYKISNNILGNIEIDNILNNLSMINDYLNTNKNDYYINFLISNYNENAQKFIKRIANTEPISLNFIDSYIYQKYYNKSLDKYAFFVDCGDMDSCKEYLIRTYNKNCSIYLIKKQKYLNFSLYILVSIILLFLVFNRKKDINVH